MDNFPGGRVGFAGDMGTVIIKLTQLNCTAKLQNGAELCNNKCQIAISVFKNPINRVTFF
jgi:hypothetical protein